MTMVAVDLRAEAAAEVNRLTKARAVLRDGDQRALAQLDGTSPWIAMPWRTSLRRSLGHHICLVWRVTVEDASGRTVESRVVPLLLAVSPDADRIVPAAARRAWIRSLLRDAEGHVRPHVEAACEGWRAEVARVTRAFTSARQRREHDVARPRSTASVASQPGLFDRRVDRSNQTRASAAAASAQATIERLRAIDGGGTIAFRPARLLLVLVP